MSFELELSKSLIFSDVYKAIEFLTLQKWQIALLFTLKSAVEKESYLFLCFLSFSRNTSAQASSREIATAISRARVRVQQALRNLEEKGLISSKKNGFRKTTYTVIEWQSKEATMATTGSHRVSGCPKKPGWLPKACKVATSSNTSGYIENVKWLPKGTILNTNIKKNNCSAEDFNGPASQLENEGLSSEEIQQSLSSLLAANFEVGGLPCVESEDRTLKTEN